MHVYIVENEGEHLSRETGSVPSFGNTIVCREITFVFP